MPAWLWVLLGAPWVGGALIIALGPRWERHSSWLAIGFVGLSALAGGVLPWGNERSAELRALWVPSAGLEFALQADALSLPFVLNVLGVSLLALCYGRGYWVADGRSHLCYALLLGFTGSMLGVLLADDVWLFFVFWEAMLITSSLLIAGWGDAQQARRATFKYFIYTQVGSLLILVALLVLVAEAQSSSIGAFSAGIIRLSQRQLVGLTALLIVGFSFKMAIFPLHTWLPDAYSVAPMPATILLAAATSSLGAYGILRFPLKILQLGGMTHLQLPLMILALCSQIYGALMSLASRDLKRIVAYSSVSQMGYVLFALASLVPQGIAGGILHVINQGIVKALLFMGVGLIMQSTQRRQIDELGGLMRLMPGVALGMGIGALAIMGMPPFCVFHSEWMILSAGLSSRYPLLGYLELLAPLFTAAYALWLALRLALSPASTTLVSAPSPLAMRWPFYALVALNLVFGLYPASLYGLIERAAQLVGGL